MIKCIYQNQSLLTGQAAICKDQLTPEEKSQYTALQQDGFQTVWQLSAILHESL